MKENDLWLQARWSTLAEDIATRGALAMLRLMLRTRTKTKTLALACFMEVIETTGDRCEADQLGIVAAFSAFFACTWHCWVPG